MCVTTRAHCAWSAVTSSYEVTYPSLDTQSAVEAFDDLVRFRNCIVTNPSRRSPVGRSVGWTVRAVVGGWSFSGGPEIGKKLMTVSTMKNVFPKSAWSREIDSLCLLPAGLGHRRIGRSSFL